jgi:hypothetical protein
MTSMRIWMLGMLIAPLIPALVAGGASYLIRKIRAVISGDGKVEGRARFSTGEQ